MGFYGNITNTTSSQFTFDKIYPNRQAMDAGVTTDGVYVNRFVLIEYDTEVTFNNNMTKVYSVKDGVAYLTESDEDDLEYITNRMVKENSNLIIIYTATIDYSQSMPIETNHTFYKYSKTDNDNDGAAKYLPISENDTDSNYIKNYSIDIAAYPDAKRGYDSTVWQKMYVNNEEKYVMIAELNSVVPTFDVSPDAPTMNPIAPHFDANSTNVYYKLHWQAPWGFRVAQASNENLSDEKTTWTTYTYNEITNTHTEIKDENVSAAIYYNKEAFDSQVNETEIKKHADPKIKDEIKITPTGKSGNKYNKHDGTADLGEIADIQEMTINLPSIGNMMSDAWDIIHGPARNNSKSQSLQGILDTFKDMESNQIPYKRESNGEIVGADLVGDNWISATLDDDTQKINIIHQAPGSIEDSTAEIIDFTKTDSGNQFSYHALEPDDKGHVRKGTKQTTIILPNGFNKIQTANGSSLVEATTPRSAFKIATDNWIHVEKPEGINDTLKLFHRTGVAWAEQEQVNKENNAERFEFLAPLAVDNAGHTTQCQMKYVYFPWSFSKVETDKENSSVVARTVNSTFKIGGDNKWTETEVVDDDKILVKHKAKENALKDSYYEDPYVRSSIDAKIDEAGHIIEYRQIFSPASFSAINAHVPGAAEPFKISASFGPGRNSVDIYGDSFITLSGNTTTKESDDGTFHTYKSGFTINHVLPDQFEVSSSTQSDAKEIITYNDSYDGAGHRIGRDRIIYKLPNYYSAIEIPAKEGAVSITPNAKGSIIFKGKSEEKEIGNNTKTTTNWITVSGDKDSNTILIDHSNPNSEDPNQTEVNPTEFAQVPYFSYDSKGHITASGFNNLVGDDWLSWEKNNADIKVSHGKAVMPKSGSWNIAGRSDNPSNPGPGSTITVPYIEFDDKGHINHVDNVEVTMPLTTTAAVVSIDNSDYRDDNTLIIKKLESETNGPIIKPKYITTDDLKLYGYTTKETVSATESLKIGSEDTINSAIEKLEYRIDKIPSETEIYDNVFNGTDTQVLETLTYQDHKLVPRYHTTDTFKINGYRNTSTDPREQVDDGDTINSALKKIVFQISSIEIADKNSPYVKVRGYTEQSIYDNPIYYPEKEELQVINNGMTLNEALSLIEENIRILCFRISSLYGQQRTIESSFTEDEIEQIANNLDNV